MKSGNEMLSQAYRDATRSARRDACPPAGVLVAAAAGALTRDEHKKLLDHVGTCSDCADEMRRVLTVLPGERPVLSTARFRVPRAAWALAAAVLVAVGAGILVSRPWLPTAPSSGERGGPSADHLTEPADGSRVALPPAELSWRSAPPAEEYELVLYDQESRVLWRSGPGRVARASLPPDVRARLVPGHRYVWRVHYVQGVERLESPLFGFALR